MMKRILNKQGLIGLFLLGLSVLFVNVSYAQNSLYSEWDGFQRSQETVQDVDTYFAQNGRPDISIMSTANETRVAVFSFDLSGVSANVDNMVLKLYNTSTSGLNNTNLVVYAKQHGLASDVAPTWAKLNLSSSFGDEVLTTTISDNNQNEWMDFSSPQLTQKINEARVAGKKIALILKYPEAATDGVLISFANTNAYTNSSPEGSGPTVDPQSSLDAKPVSNSGAEDYIMVFSDEFNDTQVDSSKWSVQTRTINRTHFQLYANEDQAEEKEGNLRIYYSKDMQTADTYYAGRVDSKGKYYTTYGFMEVRMKVSAPQGHQMAFWMMPQGDGMNDPLGVDGTANDGAEIDVCETNKTTTFSTGLHYDGYSSNHKSKGGNITATYHDGEYHVWGFEWTEAYMKWYFDGKVVRTVTTSNLIVHADEYLYLSGSMWHDNTWVSGDIYDNELIQGGGQEISYVDYVRVYKQGALDHRPHLQYSSAASIDAQCDVDKLLIYPNPASSTVHFSEELSAISFLTLDGRMVKHLNSVSQVDVSDLHKGIYLLEGNLRDGETYREKLVIQ